MPHDILLANLRSLLQTLPHESNSISPSVYDTAQVLRFSPPTPIWPAFDWLIEAQAADGGWGDPAAGDWARTLPTLAVVLLLAEHQERRVTREALRTGLAWLCRAGATCTGSVPDDAPVGVELLLPSLLDDAQRKGLAISLAPYHALRALGATRRARVARIPAHQLPGSTAAHSWESFATSADPNLVHPISGVGGSPAATAAWLQLADEGNARMIALDYLHRAEAATNTGVPGVTPTVFPIGDFMQTYSLHSLAQTGLITLPAIADLVAPMLDDLAARMGRNGIGFAAGFMPDADDTAAVLGALLAAGRSVDLDPLRSFEADEHFATYSGEIQPSLITTARAIQVYAAAGRDVTPFRAWVARRQHHDGRWISDKWNAFWGYCTWQAVLALRDDACYGDALVRVADAILAHQYRDGGWGVGQMTPEATAYALLALAALPVVHQTEPVLAALARGRLALFHHYQPFGQPQELHWVGKERYCPIRLHRLFILAALLSTEQLCGNDPLP
jgi:halimadienyl-diphosphate synthase